MSNALPELRLEKLLQDHPPGTAALVRGQREENFDLGIAEYVLLPPDVQMACPRKACNGLNFFSCAKADSDLRFDPDRTSYLRIVYVCTKCSESRKVYVLEAEYRPEGTRLLKFGETPEYSPRTPDKLLSLVGSERDAFFKGRRCENQHLGVGAFTYYRKVVEAQRSKLFDQIISAGEKLQMSPEKLGDLRKAAEEKQFAKSLEMAKDVLPNQLLIDGHSPLKLLHAAFSNGIHNLTDDQCLANATHARIVLGELVEKLDRVMKDDVVVNAAVQALLTVRDQNSASSQNGTASD